MSNYVLDRAYLTDEPNGIERNRVVVQSDEETSCAYPAAENAGDIVGVTMHTQTREGRSVTVRRMGIAPVEAASAIASGDFVAIADNTGRIKKAEPPSALLGTQGQNDAVRYRALFPTAQNIITKVTHVQSGTDTPLSATVSAGVVTINLATDSGGDVTTTATALVAFVNADTELGKLVKAELAGGTGAEPAFVGSGETTGYADSTNTLGIAQQTATASGDVIEVFLS